ncbi:hypothetical protein A1Q1_02338 [Trichosporon asahii var. asahii CBS 2479]|uniref:Uncharacterized protein n=1 Tax=Trichosporon asahii var. asahii (strain ATCC 90039 / CBS 2479 / JCM 2466 / KCTC 7840 / NBRC 103889/ NCYC 2677 / UAMH 7654) TaxID=1186058 RepID=J5T167_TRIAS|nr:hypothetical protein A1Q1_02338 [Trichosporon asahii var. asahii CBS 2479]EJT48611.1 hypothetical protein A1Q1_02338 [Trichosporon asahii var. asahii CBS 2479]
MNNDRTWSLLPCSLDVNPVLLRGIRGIIMHTTQPKPSSGSCERKAAGRPTPWIPHVLLSRVTPQPQPRTVQPVRTPMACSVLSPPQRPAPNAPPQAYRMAPSQSQKSQPTELRADNAPSVLDRLTWLSFSRGYSEFARPLTAIAPIFIPPPHILGAALHAPSKCQQARRAQAPHTGELNVMHNPQIDSAGPQKRALRYLSCQCWRIIAPPSPDLGMERGPRTPSFQAPGDVLGTCHNGRAFS